MSKLSSWIFFCLLSFLPGWLQAQEELVPTDSIGFFNFLESQREIPGLGFRFVFSEAGISEAHVGDSLFSLSKTDSGYVSALFTDFSWIDELERPLKANRLDYQIQLLVYSQPQSVGGAGSYLSDLIAKGDYLVKVRKDLPAEDLVSLAAQAPYTPLQKFRLKFVTDYRLFVVTLTIVFFFLSSIVMLVCMLVMRARKNKREYLENKYERMVIDPLTSLLFEKELAEIHSMDTSEIHSYFDKNLLSKPLFRHVLIEAIIGLNKKMKGDFKEKLKALYKTLELDKVTIKSLHHKKWDRVTMALVQINEMDLIEALPEVKKKVSSTNFHIRSMAVSTLLNLSEKVDLTFLRDLTFPLSLWQQMNYLRIIRFVSSHKDLKIGILFDSKNQSVRMFGIKLVRILGRVDMIELLADLADSVSDEEKIEILETYAALGAHMESDFVNSCLKSENPSLSLSAAKAAAVIGDAESEEILLGLLETEPLFGRRLVYLKALKELNEEKFDVLTSGSSSPELMAIRNHILDPLLQNV